MILPLACHSQTPPHRVQGIAVQIERTAEGSLWLEFCIHGASALVLPERRDPGRADELWRTTCLELFFKPDGSEGYKEFNFSPSFQWAAYEFDGYRSGMRDLVAAEDPGIEISGRQEPFLLAAAPRPADILAGAGAIALSAVIEETDGAKSYWALAHPPGAPDFHHPACFAATLPPPARP